MKVEEEHFFPITHPYFSRKYLRVFVCGVLQTDLSLGIHMHMFWS